ncbi:MAG: pectinesterase family protein, partial [Verrucomicrobiota bacterium]|nr:pectinesterase family protein [Verrucomicrobiota bacterium]
MSLRLPEKFAMMFAAALFVENCLIEGDVDFIWGYGAVCFERCELRALHDGYYVQARNAAGRTGYVFIDCRLTAAPGVQKCWLARIEADRFPASHVAFLNCRMGSHIPAAGWLVTGGHGSPLRFHEFQSTGPGGEPLDLSHRHPVSSRLDAAEASTW